MKYIGHIEKIPRQVLDNMLSGDRAYCAMKIRRLKSETIRAEEQCRGCTETYIYEFSLDQYTTNRLDESDYRIETEAGKPVQVFDLEDLDLGLKCSFRYMKGEDERAIEPIMRRNPFEAQFTLWHRCLQSWILKGEEIENPFHKAMWDDLQDDIIDFVDLNFDFSQPGPLNVHSEVCAGCGRDVEISLQNSDFLLTSRVGTRRKSSRK